MSISSTSKPRSLRRCDPLLDPPHLAGCELLLAGQLRPQRVVPLLDQLDDLVRPAPRGRGSRWPAGRAARRRRSRTPTVTSYSRMPRRTASAAARRSRRRRGTPRSRRRCGGTARSTGTRRPSRSRRGAAGPAAPPARRSARAGCRRRARAGTGCGRAARTAGAGSAARPAAPRRRLSTRPVTTPCGTTAGRPIRCRSRSRRYSRKASSSARLLDGVDALAPAARSGRRGARGPAAAVRRTRRSHSSRRVAQGRVTIAGSGRFATMRARPVTRAAATSPSAVRGRPRRDRGAATTSSRVAQRAVRRLRQPQPMQPSSLSRSRSIRSDLLVEPGPPGAAERVQSALVGVRFSGQGRQRLRDLVEAEPDPLGGPDEGDPAQLGLLVAALVARRTTRPDQAARLVEADRGRGHARPLGELPDRSAASASSRLP